VAPQQNQGQHDKQATEQYCLDQRCHQDQVAPLDKWDPGKACGPEHHRQGAPAEEIEEIRAVITRWLQEERILAQKTISPGASGPQGVGGFAWRHDLLRKIGYKR
jgi:hypothetical protein